MRNACPLELVRRRLIPPSVLNSKPSLVPAGVRYLLRPRPTIYCESTWSERTLKPLATADFVRPPVTREWLRHSATRWRVTFAWMVNPCLSSEVIKQRCIGKKKRLNLALCDEIYTDLAELADTGAYIQDRPLKRRRVV